MSIPLEQLEQRLAELPPDREIVAYCRGPYCLMAVEAARLLRARNLRARRMADGVSDWQGVGLPVATGVAYHPEHRIERVDPKARRLSFANGASGECDLLIYVPPHRAPSVVRQAGLVDEGGWVPVDPRTLRTDVPGFFGIGDVTSIPIPSGKVLPKAGVFAHSQAEVVAENLALEWSGRTPDRTFDGTGACFIATGSGRAGYGSGNFYGDPAPEMRFHPPSRRWHLGKVLFEKHWLWKWF